MSSKLKDIYSIFAPSPLRPEQNALYVDLEPVRGNAGLVHRMAQKIRLADKPTCQVLTGHRGSGKSTELSRLCQALEETTDPDTRSFVVQIQADDELDRNDIAAGVKRCRSEAMRSYRRLLRQDHWPLIEEVRRTGQVFRTNENDTAFRELLDSRAILLYANDEEWYGLNPAIEDLPRPGDGEQGEVAS